MPTAKKSSGRTTPPKTIKKLENKLRNPAAPTPASEWGKKTLEQEGFVVELPSGNFARVRRTLDFMVLLSSGKIPNPLRGVLQKMIDTSTIPTDQMDMTMLTQLGELLDSNTVSIMIEPRVSRPEPRRPNESDADFYYRIGTWEPEEGTVSIYDIDITDKMYLLFVGQGGAADLEKFREQSFGPMDSLQAGNNVRAEAKSTGGDK